MLRKLFVLVLLMLVLTVGAGAQDAEPIQQDFFLSFIPNVQFSPFYVAIDKGYFAEAGYDFTITYGDENIGMEQIASGALSFGAISGEQVLLARAGQRPVVYLYAWFHKYPVGVVIPDTTGATSMEELRGKRVGVPGRFGASYSGVIALLAANNMTELDIQLEPIGFNAPEVVCAGQIDAATIYLNNEPLQIQQRIDAGDCGNITGLTVLAVGDVADIVSNGIVTNEMMINEQPERVRAVVAAFDQALHDVINNPAEAYLISLNHVENLEISDTMRAALEAESAARIELLAESPDRETIISENEALLARLQEQFTPSELIQFVVLLETIKLWDSDTLGVMTPESWAQTRDILNLLGATIDEGVIDVAYTVEFLPQREPAGE